VIGPNRRWLGGFVLAAALFPCSARAQALAQSFEDLRQTLKVGQRVVVTDESGQKSKGRVDELSTSSFTVGPRTFTEVTVTEIRIPDPLWNGALIGAAIGAGLATWDYMIDPSEPGNAAIFTVAIGLGTAIGAGIDALTSREGKLLYAAPRQRRGLMISPLIEKHRQAAFVSFRF
jgi:multidrug efflux pump subunit AcrA (membrane-fusion protein)